MISQLARRSLGVLALTGLTFMPALLGAQDPDDDKIKKAKDALTKERDQKNKEIQDRIDASEKMLGSTVLSSTEKPEVNNYLQGSGMGMGMGMMGGMGYGMGGLGGLGNGTPGGYMNGLSNLTQANANSFFTNQQTLLGQQQVNRARTQNKLATFDENMYELSKTPEVYAAKRTQREALRDQNRIEKLNRSTSIQSDEAYLIDNGFALNKLLDQVKTLQSRFGVQGPNIPLSPDILQHLNLATPNSVAGAGPLRDPRKLVWPIGLRTRDFAPYRAEIEKMAPELVSQAASGNTDGDLYNSFMTSIAKFQDYLKDQVEDMRTTDYILAKRYLGDLEDAGKAMAEPSNSTLFLNSGAKPQASTVGGLVAQMTATGMRFGPATTPDIASYRAFYQQFRAYEDNLSRSVGAR